ncbi:tyrosine-type recombinase/integrase [Nocardia wallacei]|uniref:tyrosine-type recombinase/integrase n=1 Tax=Nocardia wallacei TaxID=480035 RepID=UPI002453A51A|nr:tyrosine-type recombinase/integrase [Nocardia wallacei]
MTDDLTAAVRLIAAKLGLKPEDLGFGANPAAKPVPTFREYIGKLRSSLPSSTVHTYDPYWRVIEKAWGERYLNEPTATEIDELVKLHRARAVVRRNSRDGRGAAIHMVTAFRSIYNNALRDGIPTHNPARRATIPRRLPSPRHALTRDQVLQIGQIASTTGNDIELDSLLVRLHIESACRRSGALNLGLDDLDVEDCLIKLREKGETVRWQPITPMLMQRLLEHALNRGGRDATDRVLRYRNLRPIGISRYTYLTNRLYEHLPWAARLQISAHWVRHTTLTFVDREFGPAVAHAYAGHTDNPRFLGSTGIYTAASIIEVAEALVALTGQPHPLAREVRHPLAPRGRDDGNL